MKTFAFLPPAAPATAAASSRSSFLPANPRQAHAAPAGSDVLLRRHAAPTAVVAQPSPAKLSKVEGIKTRSNGLRYPLNEELKNSEPNITDESVQIMKFHGSYQQDDREKRFPGQPKAWQFMLRLKMPAGEMPANMYLTLDKLSEQYGNHTLRATTRSAWQMHGILKSDLKSVFGSIMDSGGSCVGACGDINRNIVATPAPFVHKPYQYARHYSKMLAEVFAPQTGAFSEIWLDGEKAASLEYWKNDINMNTVKKIMSTENGNGTIFKDHIEPIYGDVYLPRKFKMGVTVPGDNSIDIYIQDIGVVVITSPTGMLEGFNVTVGGGLGRTHKKESTFARAADHLGFVRADKFFDLMKSIIAAQRDHGNRENRANSRLKYTIHRMGIDKFRELVESYLGEKVEPWRELPKWEYKDWLGWHDQGDGLKFLGLFIENGRIKDDGDMRLKSAFRFLCQSLKLDMVVTPNQNVIFRNIAPNQVKAVEAILAEHGVKLPSEYHRNRVLSMACPALPLCGLAVTEAERVMPAIVDRVTALCEKVGVDVPIHMRMTGCPNGCARPYMAELGFVGSGPDAYQIWAGGCPNQTHLAWPLYDKVKDSALEAVFEPILVLYRDSKNPGESFGDFCSRVGKEELVRVSEPALLNSAEKAPPVEAPVAKAASVVPASKPASAAPLNGASKSSPVLALSTATRMRLALTAQKMGVSVSELANKVLTEALSPVSVTSETFQLLQDAAVKSSQSTDAVAEDILTKFLNAH
eukprot:CAMPEP_0184716924 /NCGR_PEP_ID=MMETSP0314-20130426/6530_1 /TAXON_ID=38298 /ORGANISM="Rhodella maculata, Strain CCMP 736" /LENGTH=751 /DNA_ID=CAMNT_0027180411 /DNA_START=11 /DNA_END=2266 /DNA_ORIENTATION=+